MIQGLSALLPIINKAVDLVPMGVLEVEVDILHLVMLQVLLVVVL